MSILRSLQAALICALLPSALALGQDQKASMPPDATPPALKIPLRSGYRLVRQFSAISGLTGWIMQSSKGEYSLFYTTADGQAILSGMLMSSAGENLSQRYLAEYVPKLDLDELWNRLTSSSQVVAGQRPNAVRVIYVIMDPNCIFCHLLWQALKPYEAAGLQVRWVPIPLLRPDSLTKAAGLLQGGESVLTKSQEAFDQRTETAGPVDIEVTPAMRARLDANLALYYSASARGTPTLIYKDGSGKVQVRSGLPSAAELTGITAIAPPANADSGSHD